MESVKKDYFCCSGLIVLFHCGNRNNCQNFINIKYLFISFTAFSELGASPLELPPGGGGGLSARVIPEAMLPGPG